MKRKLIIVPAYNEARNIAVSIKEIKRYINNADILLVDDGSTDKTAEVSSNLGLSIHSLPFNNGIGNAIRTGIEYAMHKGYDYLLRIDADGQHDPAEAHRLIEKIERDASDVVFGSRFIEKKGYQSSMARRVLISILAKIITVVFRQKITDPTSGFWICNKRVMGLLSSHRLPRYPEIEILLILKQNNFRLSEMPVMMRPRRSGFSSINIKTSLYYAASILISLYGYCFGFFKNHYGIIDAK